MNQTIVYQVRKIGAWNVYFKKGANERGIVGANISGVIADIKANRDFFSVEPMPGYSAMHGPHTVDMEGEVNREVHRR